LNLNYLDAINNIPNAITIIQNRYAAMEGIDTHPMCITTINSTNTTAIAFRIERVLLLIKFSLSKYISKVWQNTFVIYQQFENSYNSKI